MSDRRKIDSNLVAKRFGYLDACRGFAAFSILLFHTYGFPIFSTLYSFVDFFFVLSGFVLAPSYNAIRSVTDARKFLLNRIIRLFPMVFTTIFFVIMIQIMVNIKHLVRQENHTPTINLSIPTILSSLLLLQIFSHSATLLNFPLWSLSAEWLSNLAGISKLKLKGATPAILAVSGILLIIASLITQNSWEVQLGRALLGFYYGIILRIKAFNPSKKSLGKLLTAFILIFTLHLSLYFISPLINYLSPLIYGYAILQLSYWGSPLDSRLSKMADLLGKYSYGFYAWSFPLLSLSSIFVKKGFMVIPIKLDHHEHISFLVCICLTILSTYLTISYIEKAFRALASKHLH